MDERMKRGHYISLALFGVMIHFTTPSVAQKILIPITARDNGAGVATNTFGFHPNATYCIDGQIDPDIVEEELPMGIPGIFDFRFIDHRPVSSCIGIGLRVHVQEYFKADTFRIEFHPGVAGYPFTFSWPAGLDTLFEYLTIGVPGAFAGPLDMLVDTTLQVSNPSINTLDIVGKVRQVETWGTVSPGVDYTITPSGFKEPPGPGEGAGIVVDGLGFEIRGTPGAEVTVHFTLPEAFVPEGSSSVLPLNFWTFSFGDNCGWSECGPLPVGDSVIVTIFGSGVVPLYLGAFVTVPANAFAGSYSAQVIASYPESTSTISGVGRNDEVSGLVFDTVVSRTLQVVKTTDALESPAVITEFRLHPNYPNPFHPSPTIAYEIPVTADVRLSVFNVIGQEVAVLVNGRQALGQHSVTFDAGNLPSGVYACRITAGTFTDVKMMLLMK